MQLFVRELEADELLVDTVRADDTEGDTDIFNNILVQSGQRSKLI